MADTAVDASKASEDPSHPPHKEKFWALALGSIGVVFGDIGTSPLYAMREALHHSQGGGGGELAVLGVVSLIFWALILVVTRQVRRLPDAGRQQGRRRHPGPDGAGPARQSGGRSA